MKFYTKPSLILLCYVCTFTREAIKTSWQLQLIQNAAALLLTRYREQHILPVLKTVHPFAGRFCGAVCNFNSTKGQADP